MSVIAVIQKKLINLLLLCRTTTVSLRSSVYDHVAEDGRTYHRYREGSKIFLLHVQIELTDFLEYPLPNDEEEQERLGGYKSSAPFSKTEIL